MSNVPEIRVYSPPGQDSTGDKASVFSWQTPKFGVSGPSFSTKSDNQFRFFGTQNKGVNIYFKGDKTDTLHTLNLVNWENTFNMRSCNLNNFPTSTTSYRTAYRSQAVAMQRARLGLITGTAKSLDILRQNMQKFINREIDDIIQKYIDRFFKPGIENIKNNNGEGSVSEQHIQSVCRQILEEAKKMYQTATAVRVPSPSDLTDQENSLSSEPKVVASVPKVTAPSRKRKESDTDSEASFVPVAPKKRRGRKPNALSGRSTPMKFKVEQVRREGPKWDPERLRDDTHFMMGAKANKALGLGATRGRLYIKHPDVFKYSGDQEDKQWLYDHNLMPATGGKAYMLLVDDIKELAESEEYRNNPALMTDEIVGFSVPDSMLLKMRQYMLDLRTDAPVKRRGRLPAVAATNHDSNHSELEKLGSRTASPIEDIELLRSNDPSPFGLGFDDVSPCQPDVSPAPSDVSNTFEPPMSAPFDIANSP